MAELQGKDSEIKEDPGEVLENLEDKDLERMKCLGQNESQAILGDLEVAAGEYPTLMTTF